MIWNYIKVYTMIINNRIENKKKKLSNLYLSTIFHSNALLLKYTLIRYKNSI